MSLEQPSEAPRRTTRPGLKIALVAAGLAAGAIGATAIGAAASPSGTTSGSGTTQSTAPSADQRAGHPGPGGAMPIRSDEKPVTATRAATLRAAALKAVPGATVLRVETDAGDAAYEVHMTKADGSPVTVKFDKNLNKTAVEDGMGKGDPAPAGAGRNGMHH
jgi:hypothetical protein